jgi:hypothetical protein
MLLKGRAVSTAKVEWSCLIARQLRWQVIICILLGPFVLLLQGMTYPCIIQLSFKDVHLVLLYL